MTSDSNTLAIVLTKAASCSGGLEKEAMPFLRAAGGAMKSFGSKLFSRGTRTPGATRPPPLPTAAADPWGARHAVSSATQAVTGTAGAATKYPRIFNRTTPIAGNYGTIYSKTGWGSKLDNMANKGWGRRFLTAPLRNLGRAGGLSRTVGMGGLLYGGSAANANRKLEGEFETVGTNAAAQALIQQRQWARENPFRNAISGFVSDDTYNRSAYDYLMGKKMTQGVGQALGDQLYNPDHFTNVLQGVKQNHKYPWTSFFG